MKENMIPVFSTALTKGGRCKDNIIDVYLFNIIL